MPISAIVKIEAWVGRKDAISLQTGNYAFHLHLFTLEKPRNENTKNFVISLLPIACGIIMQPMVSILMPFFKNCHTSDNTVLRHIDQEVINWHFFTKSLLKNYENCIENFPDQQPGFPISRFSYGHQNAVFIKYLVI